MSTLHDVAVPRPDVHPAVPEVGALVKASRRRLTAEYVQSFPVDKRKGRAYEGSQAWFCCLALGGGSPMTTGPFSTNAIPPSARPGVTASGPAAPHLTTFTAKHCARSSHRLANSSDPRSIQALLCHRDVGTAMRRACVLNRAPAAGHSTAVITWLRRD